MKIIVSFFLLLISYCSLGQTGDNIAIVANSQILFNYANADELLADKVISNAFEIRLSSQNKNSNVSAGIIYTGVTFPQNLVLKLNHKTSTNSLDNGLVETPLTTQSHLLFTQPKIAGTNSFFYDLVLHPSNTFTTPATYNFSVIFTMTQL